MELLKKRLYYNLPNGRYHSFLTFENHKYAVCCTQKDTVLGFSYTDDYAIAKTTAANWSNKFNNTKEGYKKFVVVDIKEVK